MPLTIIPLAINIVTVVAIWMSPLSVVTKIVITVLLVIKIIICFRKVFWLNLHVVKNFDLIVVGFMDVTGIVFTTVCRIWTAVGPLAILLVLLIIWRLITAINLSKKGGS